MSKRKLAVVQSGSGDPTREPLVAADEEAKRARKDLADHEAAIQRAARREADVAEKFKSASEAVARVRAERDAEIDQAVAGDAALPPVSAAMIATLEAEEALKQELEETRRGSARLRADRGEKEDAIIRADDNHAAAADKVLEELGILALTEQAEKSFSTYWRTIAALRALVVATDGVRIASPELRRRVGDLLNSKPAWAAQFDIPPDIHSFATRWKAWRAALRNDANAEIPPT
jgi:chromosome segregation ATPase